MKYKVLLLICLSSIFLIIGCTQSKDMAVSKKIEQNQQTINSDKKDPYKITGEITIELPAVIVKGRTNLKPGTKFMLLWRDKNLGEMEVKKDGSFKLTVERPKFQLGDELVILFNPDIQSKKIQNIYGENGQKLRGRYLYHYSKDGKDYSGLKAGTYIDDLKTQIMERVIQSVKILEKERQDFLDKQQ